MLLLTYSPCIFDTLVGRIAWGRLVLVCASGTCVPSMLDLEYVLYFARYCGIVRLSYASQLCHAWNVLMAARLDDEGSRWSRHIPYCVSLSYFLQQMLRC
ncbi:hypothetical protein RvY_11217 [Ramazzottius varieornatus]|uniref:Uncharacterized protein n=1 Tax=Ramazzottius varieornatus TaxID=947166 RepID=A0A1D1VN56_RAMVA|nr:hypothetical protein RvY_11217 [Ramazzottius varieornatus]